MFHVIIYIIVNFFPYSTVAIEHGNIFMNVSMYNDNTVNLYYSLTQFIHSSLSFVDVQCLFSSSISQIIIRCFGHQMFVLCFMWKHISNDLMNAVQPYEAAHKSITPLEAWCRFHVFEWNEIKKGKQKENYWTKLTMTDDIDFLLHFER